MESLEERRLLAVIATDNFESYPAGVQLEDGADVGLNGGTGFTDEWEVDNARRAEVTVISPGLSYSNGDIQINGGNRALQFAASEAGIVQLASRAIPTQTGDLYLSFLYNNTADAGSVGASGDDFNQFGFDSTGPLPNPNVSAMDRNTTFEVRSTEDSVNSVSSGITSVAGETYFVVLKATRSGGDYNQISLFIDPATATEPGTADATSTVDSGISSAAVVALRKAFQESGDTYVYDQIRVGTTYADVLPLDAIEDSYSGADEDTVFTVADGPTDLMANDEGPAQAVVFADNTSANGATVSANADGSFSYDPANAPEIQSLPEGGSLTDTFTYAVTDGSPATGRFVRIQNNGTESRRMDIGEIEVFAAGVVPGPIGSNSAIDLAFSGNGATIEAKGAISGFSQPHGAGGADANLIDAAETAGGATWSSLGVGNFVIVDLGASFDLGLVRVHQRNDGCCQDRLMDYTVSVLADDGGGNPGAVVSRNVEPGQPATNGFSELLMQSTDTATVSVQVAGANDPPVAVDDSGYATNEDTTLTVDAFGPPVNLAPNGVASQSTTDFGGDASRANDDNTNSTFTSGSVTHTAIGSYHYWQVQLDGNSSVQNIVLHNRGDCCGDRLQQFRVSVFDGDPNNGGNEVFFQNNPGAVAQGGNVTFNAGGVVGNYVRVAIDPLSAAGDAGMEGDGVTPLAASQQFLSLAEVQVFGNKLAGLLGNDTDPDTGAALAVLVADSTSASGAAVAVNPDGGFSYNPTGAAALQQLDEGQVLVDTFNYTISDDVAPDGLFNVQVINTTGTNPGTSTPNWLGVWDALDGGAGPTGTVAGFNIVNNTSDTEVSFDYPGGGNFGVNRAINSINGNGPGGGGGPFNGGDNYSIRARTFLKFEAAGTYSIAMGSDDGRRIELSEASPGSAPGYSGFTARAEQNNGGFTAGDTVVGFDGGSGHNRTIGVFSVATGDILELDAFYYEGSGGDSGELSIAEGSVTSFNTTAFSLLRHGVAGILLATTESQLNVGTDSALASVAVTGVNDAPVANNDTASIAEALDGAPSPNTVTGNLLSNDTDVDDPNSSFTATPDTIVGTFGTLVINTDGSFNYTLDDSNTMVDQLLPGQTLTEMFGYTMSDNHSGGNGKADTASLGITINGSNDSPTATDNTAAVTEDTALTDTGNLITDDDGNGADSDVESPPSSLTVLGVDGESNPANDVVGTFGTLDWNADGSYAYTLDNANPTVNALAVGESLTDSFTYTLADPVVSGDGLMNVQVVNTTTPNPGTTTANWLSLFNALDGGAGPTGMVAGFNVVNNSTDTEVSFDYASGGNYGVNRAINSINGNGPGGAGGPFNGNNDYSIRSRAFLAFNRGGTYSISLGSDDGRRIELTKAAAGSAPGYSGFTSVGDQQNNNITDGGTVIGFNGNTGHNQTVGVFTVAAGDVLELDAFYYQGGGGHSGEISIAAGNFGSFTNTTDFKLLQDGTLGIALGSTNSFSQQSTDTATLVVTVNGSNDGPQANDDTQAEVGTVPEDSTGTTLEVLANDTDPDTSNSLTVTAVDNTGTLGIASVGGGGANVSYNPNFMFEGLDDGETATDTFAYTITDTDGETDTATVTVTIDGSNDAPVAHAGGSYEFAEGDTFTFDGSLSSDIDIEPLSYAWDLDNDGQYDDATGEMPMLSFAQLQALGIDDGSEGGTMFTIGVQVSDGDLTDTATTSLTLFNAPPVAHVAAPAEVVPGFEVTFTVSADDPSLADDGDSFTYKIDFDGDGTFDATDTGPAAGATFATQYGELGQVTVRAIAIDKDNGTSDVREFLIDVVPVAQVGIDVFAGGTDGSADRIIFYPVFGGLQVRYNNTTYPLSGGSFPLLPDPSDPTGPIATRMLAFGRGSSDQIIISGRIDAQAEFDGGEGNDYLAGSDTDDTLIGGAGNDVILAGEGDNFLDGSAGNDRLEGRSGNDVLFGGTGNDRLNGNAGDDILDGGADNDFLFGGSGNDLLVGREGIDTLNGHFDNDVILGGDAADQLFGGDGQDLLIGGDSSDRLRGDGGEDDLIGGSSALDDDIELALNDMMAMLGSALTGNVATQVNEWYSTGTDREGFEDFLDDNIADDLTGGSGADEFLNDTDQIRDQRDDDSTI